MSKNGESSTPAVEDIGGLDKLKDVVRGDGWINVLTGMGVKGKDPDSGAGITLPHKFSEIDLEAIYRSDGMASRIVDLPAEDMTREGFEIIGDADGEIVNYIEQELDVMQKFEMAKRWQDVFGASIIVMTINDGGTFTDPLDMNNIKEVEELNVYDRWRLSHTSIDVQSDPEEKNYGELEFVDVSPIRGGVNSRFKVHTSRILWFNNNIRTARSFMDNNRFGDSVYTKLWKQLYRLDKGYDSVGKILDDFITSIFSVAGLQSMIASGNEKLIRDRINLMDLTRRIMNSVIMDEKEQYQKHASSISSLPELMERLETQVAAVTGIPLTVLLGIPPKGFGGKEDPSTRKWYDSVASKQIKEFLKPLTYLTEIVQLSSDGPTKGIELDEWSIEFNSLWQPTDEQVATQRKTTAESDAMYIDRGVLQPEEVRNSRFGGDNYSMETEINETSDPARERELERQQQLEDEERRNAQRLKEIEASNRRDTRTDGFIGETDVADGHSHEFFIDEEGNGITSSAEDGHSHPIHNGTILEAKGHIHQMAEKVRVDQRRKVYRSGKGRKKRRNNSSKPKKFGSNSMLKTGEPLDPPPGSPNGQVAN